jgi:hypothetical protein
MPAWTGYLLAACECARGAAQALQPRQLLAAIERALSVVTSKPLRATFAIRLPLSAAPVLRIDRRRTAHITVLFWRSYNSRAIDVSAPGSMRAEVPVGQRAITPPTTIARPLSRVLRTKSW